LQKRAVEQADGLRLLVVIGGFDTRDLKEEVTRRTGSLSICRSENAVNSINLRRRLLDKR
jgi:hypothetical protein